MSFTAKYFLKIKNLMKVGTLLFFAIIFSEGIKAQPIIRSAQEQFKFINDTCKNYSKAIDYLALTRNENVNPFNGDVTTFLKCIMNVVSYTNINYRTELITLIAKDLTGSTLLSLPETIDTNNLNRVFNEFFYVQNNKIKISIPSYSGLLSVYNRNNCFDSKNIASLNASYLTYTNSASDNYTLLNRIKHNETNQRYLTQNIDQNSLLRDATINWVISVYNSCAFGHIRLGLKKFPSSENSDNEWKVLFVEVKPFADCLPPAGSY